MLTKNGWINEPVQWLPLEKIGKLCNCGEIPKELISNEGDIPLYKVGTLGKQATDFISYETFLKYKEKFPYPKKGNILITTAGTVGKLLVFDGSPSYFWGNRIKWLENDENIVLNKYLYYLYTEIKWQNWEVCQGQIAHLLRETFYNTVIPCPSFEIQEFIIEKLDKFEALIHDELSSIQAEIIKRKEQYNYYRDKALTFKVLKTIQSNSTQLKTYNDMPLFSEVI